MAHYGTMIAWAKAAGRQNVVSLLEETLKEEEECRFRAERMRACLDQRAAASYKQAA